MRIELPILLSSRFREILRVVLCAYNDLLVRAVGVERIGNVGAERSVATLVLTDFDPVDPYRRMVINCFEMEQQAHAWREWICLKRSAVPDRRMEAGLPDAAGFSLRAEWNEDLARPLNVVRFGIRPSGIETQIPETIEALPSGAKMLGPWVLVAIVSETWFAALHPFTIVEGHYRFEAYNAHCGWPVSVAGVPRQVED